MTHRQRLVADRFLAVPVAVLSNLLARLMGTILRRDHSVEPTNVNTIAVAKLVGMGSAIQATVLLRSIKQRFPDARLIFVTLRSNKGLIERLEYVDEMVCLDDRDVFRIVLTTFRALASLVRRRVDLYFDLEVYSAFACLLALYCLARNRIGFYRHSNRFKQGIYTHLVYFNTRMPIRRLYLQLGRVVGTPTPEDESLGPLRVTETDRTALEGALASLSGESGESGTSGGSGGWTMGTSCIVINPNASELSLERRWPSSYVVQTMTELASQGHHIALVGSNDEAPYVNGLYEQVPEELRARVVNTAGRLNLGEFLALLDKATCVLTNDTGPMHMSIALGRPTLCLFGPQHPDHYGFEREGVVILYAAVLCSPCIHEIETPPCHGDNVCMQRLEPALVIDALLRLLDEQARSQPGKKPASGRSIKLPLLSDGPEGQPLGYLVRTSLRRQER